MSTKKEKWYNKIKMPAFLKGKKKICGGSVDKHDKGESVVQQIAGDQMVYQKNGNK